MVDTVGFDTYFLIIGCSHAKSRHVIIGEDIGQKWPQLPCLFLLKDGNSPM